MNHETNEESCRSRTSQNERDGTDGTDGRGVLPPLARNRTLTKCASFSGASSMSMTSASAKSRVHLLSTMSKEDPPVSKRRICRGGRGGAGALKIVAALVLTLLAMELGIILAYLAPPAAGAMTSLSKALDAFTGENGQKPITLPALRVGVDPSVLELAGGLMGSLGGGAPGIGGEAKAAGVAVGKTGFALWCESAACLGDDAAAASRESFCASLDQDLLTAKADDGSPVIPLPSDYCSALEVLATNSCLCDSDLAAVSTDTDQLIKLASVTASLCGLQVDTGCN